MKEELSSKERQIQELKMSIDSNAVHSLKNIRSRDNEVSSEVKNQNSSFQIQELSKKRDQIQKLNNQLNNQMEESHKQYLVYE